jgi:hypothetical protein
MKRLQKSKIRHGASPLIFTHLLWLSLFVFACSSSEPTLSPSPSADKPPGEPFTAVTQVKGIHAVVESSSWPADPEVTHKLTPLHIRIENEGGFPVLVRYRGFSLIGPQGQYYAALPPLAAKMDVTESPTEPATESPISALSFHHQGFFVAPFYGYAYGNLPVWRHPFHHDVAYHKTFHGTYKELDISTAELKAWALPEGVIASGGSLSGYLYFEHVDPTLNRVEFRGDIVNAETGETLGTLTIPFTLDQDCGLVVCH